MGLRDKVIGGVAWTFAERFSAQFVSFVVSIILARLIVPEAFGVIAIVLVFTHVLDTFATAGFGSALIQKEKADSLDFSSVFHFNLGFSIFLYICLFISAPFIAKFYNMPIVEPVIIVIGTRVIFAGINSVQRAYVSRQMQFKRFFYSTFIGTILSAFIGIAMAYAGYGIWALVTQYLSNSVFGTIALFLIIDLRPKWEFSFTRLKTLFSFGWKILASNLMSTIYIELTDLVIGKVYNPTSLAFYNRGKKFPQLIVTQINSSIDTVLFPAMSRHQGNMSKLKVDIGYSIRISSFCIFPIIFYLAMMAEEVIRLLLTEKWMGSVVFLQIACISYALLPLSIANIQAIKAIGRSDVYLKLDIAKKIVGVSLLLCFYKQGVIAIALADAVSNVIGLLFNVFPNKKLIGYNFLDLIKDVAPAAVLTLVMCVLLYFLRYFAFSDLPMILVSIIAAFFIYIGLAYLFKAKPFLDLLSIIQPYLNKNGNK